jgi:hypothetical protein
MTPKFPRNSESLSFHVISQFSWYPPGTNFSESKKIDNVAHCRYPHFMRNVFLFDSTIFSNHLCWSLFMKLFCCSSWPPTPCFITQTGFPHFFLLQLPYPESNRSYINTLMPIYCLYTAMYVDVRNFFPQSKTQQHHFELRVLIAFHFD